MAVKVRKSVENVCEKMKNKGVANKSRNLIMKLL